jgi:hypothetical protein
VSPRCRVTRSSKAVAIAAARELGINSGAPDFFDQRLMPGAMGLLTRRGMSPVPGNGALIRADGPKRAAGVADVGNRRAVKWRRT